jgi:predicted porin
MQKKLIALAIASLSSAAFAQSNVTISGTLSAGGEQYKIGSANTITRAAGVNTTANTENRISDQSSRIIFNGEEKLGNGMSAWFQIDSRFAFDTGGGAIGGGNTALGLKGNWGMAGIGRWDVHYDTFAINGIEGYAGGQSLQDMNGHGIMAQVGGQTLAVGSRAANAAFYITPTMSGFTGRLALTTAAVAEGSGVGNSTTVSDLGAGYGYQAMLGYANGPINAFISVYGLNAEGRASNAVGGNLANDQRSTRVGAAYTFPMGIKVGLGWDRSTLKNVASVAAGGAVTASTVGGNNSNDMTRSAWMLPISYTTGAHNFYYTFAKAGNISSITTASAGAKQNTLGYAYTLSKRSTVGVFWTKLTNDNTTTSTFSNGGGAANTSYNLFGLAANGGTATHSGESAQQLYVGLTHKF